MRHVFILLLALSFLSCNRKVNQITRSTTSEFLKNFVLNPNPNELDTVGIIFSMDKHGQITAVGDLHLKTTTGLIVVPQEIDSSLVSFGALLSFLKLKDNDSLSARIHDSVKVLSTFKVKGGTQTRFNLDEDLTDAFNSRARNIFKNMKFMDIADSRLYLITETIRSPEVNVSRIKSIRGGVDVNAKFQNLIKGSPSVDLVKNKDNSLSYKLNSSPIIFYKLRKVNVEVIETKGPEGKILEFKLGDNVNSFEL
jgi:hypothetical protein